MCYSKVDGGYRCMPPKSLLNAYRGKSNDGYQHSTPNGAFWLNEKKDVPHVREIEQDVASLLLGFEELTLNAAEYETEVAHLGNMIAQYSDAKVEDFDRRLHEAQSLFFSFKASLRDPQLSRLDRVKIRDKLLNANLSLGYEVRSNLRDTLRQFISFDHPLKIKINGDQDFGSMLNDASKFFPSTWNQTLESTLKLNFVSQSRASWYRPRDNSMQITGGGGNFASYPSMEAAHAASIFNKRQYETQAQMVHELSHKFESVEPRIGQLGTSFRERRALPDQGYVRDGARYERDHFASYYIGRNYNTPIHTEVFSVGMESTFLGSNGALIGLALPQSANPDSKVFLHRADIEHRNLTLGIIAGIIPSFNKDTMGRPPQSVFTEDPNDPFSILDLK